MPLFKCSTCGALENTSLGHYWPTILPDNDSKPECSECQSGEWHGLFKKVQADEAHSQGTDGFYYTTKELKPGGYYERYAPKQG